MFYISIFQQVHTDFKRQFLDLTVDKLLEQFVLNKYTGLEKPGELKSLLVCVINLTPRECSLIFDVDLVFLSM